MPFQETCRMEQRVRLLADYDTGAFSVSDLCAAYGISRETFYVWRQRRADGGADWFRDRSHAPRSCPHRTPAERVDEIVSLRRRFKYFGPKKIRSWLLREQPQTPWPAASTIGELLEAAGLIQPRPRRRRAQAQGRTAEPAAEASEEWCADFKGWFRTGDNRRCDPLTVTDTFSRYLITLQIAEPTVAGVRPAFEAAFRAHGLPQGIRCDNGPPFGSQAAGGLTQLSAWWLRLGVFPRFIEPGSPQDNGRHERMHRTLKDQTSRPPANSLAEQQARFDRFREHFNTERPHEALDQTPPAQHWSASPRACPEQLPEPWYDADHQVRRVRSSGEIKWRGGTAFISECLVGELLGIIEQDDGRHLVRFCAATLGVIDRHGRFLRFAPLRHRLREAQTANVEKVSGINPV